jgi:hypothetical protein
VPKSFEGRTAKEWRNTFTAEIKNIARITHQESDTELRGTATKFDFSDKTDAIDIQVFKSKDTKPGANSCMDCHGGEFARTSAIIGYESKELTPKPYIRGMATIFLSKAESRSLRGEIKHWMTPHLMVKARLENGHVEQGQHRFSAKAFTVGLGGTAWHRLVWTTDLNFSKVESYSLRKTFTGKVNYHLFKGLKLGVEGGIFIDGYTQYSTDMAEMGMMSMSLNKDNPNLLPNLFNRLKDDKFGYWQFSAEYEYRF